jgi:hypothetical protein
MPEEAPVNIGAMLLTPFRAGQRVLDIQTKLHRWTAAKPPDIGLVESRMPGQLARPVRRSGSGKRTGRNPDTAPGVDSNQQRGWRLIQIWPGLLLWITPAGRWYLTGPGEGR